jgi:magnesium chelatase family protein
LIDRIDLRVELPTVTRAELFAERGAGEPSRAVAERVAYARERARSRLRGTPWMTNAEVPGPELRRHWPVPRAAMPSLDRALHTGRLTARGMDRVFRVAWTLADLRGIDTPSRDEVDEALNLRQAAA